MTFAFDPLTAFTLITLQMANKYMKLNITKAQEKILMHPATQFVMYFCVIYITTRKVLLSLVIVIITYILLHVLLNENNRFNILPKAWLYKERFISDYTSDKELYKNNIYTYH